MLKNAKTLKVAHSLPADATERVSFFIRVSDESYDEYNQPSQNGKQVSTVNDKATRWRRLADAFDRRGLTRQAAGLRQKADRLTAQGDAR